MPEFSSDMQMLLGLSSLQRGFCQKKSFFLCDIYTAKAIPKVSKILRVQQGACLNFFTPVLCFQGVNSSWLQYGGMLISCVREGRGMNLSVIVQLSRCKANH